MIEGKIATLEDVRRSTLKLLEERGSNYVYQQFEGNCMYVHNRGTEEETPGCAVGWIYHDLFGEMIPESAEYFSIWNKGIDRSNERKLIRRFTPEALRWLRIFQRQQDSSKTYGECLKTTEANFL